MKPSAQMHRQTGDIERLPIEQELGGSDYQSDTPLIIIKNMVCSVQTFGPGEMEEWQRRGFVEPVKIYTSDSNAVNIKIGDRFVDRRYNVVRHYTIKAPVEDLGARGDVFGIYADAKG